MDKIKLSVDMADDNAVDVNIGNLGYVSIRKNNNHTIIRVYSEKKNKGVDEADIQEVNSLVVYDCELTGDYAI